MRRDRTRIDERGGIDGEAMHRAEVEAEHARDRALHHVAVRDQRDATARIR